MVYVHRLESWINLIAFVGKLSFVVFVLDGNVKYVATLREQLEQLAEERTPEGLPRFV